jgi:hypothetical protein
MATDPAAQAIQSLVETVNAVALQQQKLVGRTDELFRMVERLIDTAEALRARADASDAALVSLTQAVEGLTLNGQAVLDSVQALTERVAALERAEDGRAE